jgi:hypothetical protein
MQPASNILSTQIDMSALQAAWQAFDTLAYLRPIHSEADYEHMVTLMKALLDVAGDDEDHPLSGLLALVALTVSKVQRFISVGSTVFPKRCGVLLRSLNYHFWD